MSTFQEKRLLLFLLHLLKENISALLLCALLFVFYRPIIGVSSALILVALVLGYANAMALNFYARSKRAALERANTLTARRLIVLSVFTFVPIYCCWILLSIIPLPSLTGWLIVQIPLVTISGVLLYGVAYNWHTTPRRIWWSIQIPIYLASVILGRLLGRLIFP